MMIQLFNTLGRELQEFKPLTDSAVSMYQCGPTVYWTQHIGNMRAFVLADLMRRSLTHCGYNVTFVRNYTDVGHLTSDGDEGEDKMEKAAKRDNDTPEAIAAKYIEQFETDIAHLNILPPTHAPKATEYIPQMIAFVEALLNSGHAYTTDTAIYFDTSTANDYTKLSRQDLEKLKAHAGSGTVSDDAKKNPTDFALWFFKTGAHEHALQTWESPFSSPRVADGRGFPGWHLECSTFIESLLGTTIDIHMGGIEHIPIHHTNEIAQSEAAHNAPLATYWLHNGHLTFDGEKMSKSAGTSVVLDDIIDRTIDPLALRYFFLGAHYRGGQNFTWDALQAAETALNKLRRHAQVDGGTVNENYMEKFNAALGDDFNFPAALALAWTLTKDSTVTDHDRSATLRAFDDVFALDLARQEAAIEIPSAVATLIEEREIARNTKDWERADQLRDEILEAGFVVSDGPDGQTIIPA